MVQACRLCSAQAVYWRPGQNMQRPHYIRDCFSTTHGVLLLVHTVVCFTYFCLKAYMTTPCHAPRLYNVE